VVPSASVATTRAASGGGEVTCDRDCAFVIGDHNFRCIQGKAGYDCQDYSNGCGMMNCEETFLVDAGGVLRQIATCEEGLRLRRENAAAAGTAAKLDDAVKTRLLVARVTTTSTLAAQQR
jgi:hypothetical protein